MIALVAAVLAAAQATVSPAQAVRTCADRWNQGNMLGWGPTVARVRARPRCKIALAVSRTDRSQTLVCVIDRFGGYTCTWIADGSPPLGKENARVDKRGVVTLEISLAGTHATPPLPWQRRYPHADGWIFPWTSAHTLRRGLRLVGTLRGRCDSPAYEGVFPKGTLRCLPSRNPVIYQPCFRQRPGGRIVACAGWPGETRFSRFVIS
jgi:hypothetical protein